MPELAEVEFYRRRWDRAARGSRIVRVFARDGARVFRGIDVPAMRRALAGTRFGRSEAAGKQMLLRFGRDRRLGLHLGMSGELRVEGPGYAPGRHDHLALATARRTLVFTDPRMFGRVRFHRGDGEPSWWSEIAPPVLSRKFTAAAVGAFLRRRSRAPVKAVLLMQERFPGIGNWMADEILWRAAIHPRRPAGSLRPAEVRALWRECRRVCRLAFGRIAGRENDPPSELNVRIPDSWLFNHRWEKGGVCPRTGKPLARAEIGGRTTCWSPARQKFRQPT